MNKHGLAHGRGGHCFIEAFRAESDIPRSLELAT
jgi:hypothetical protein